MTSAELLEYYWRDEPVYAPGFERPLPRRVVYQDTRKATRKYPIAIPGIYG